MKTGKKGARSRKSVGYEHDVAACDRCAYFKGQYMELINSIPRWHKHQCTLHQFIVEARGCCDHWKHKRTGELLAKPAETSEAITT